MKNNIKIISHGFLKEILPNSVEGEFESLHDVICYLCQICPKLKAPLHIGRYAIRVKDYDSKESIFCKLYTDELDISPYFGLSKSQGAGQLIVAAVLIVVGITLDILSAGSSGGSFTLAATKWSATAYMSALAFTISGISSLLLKPKYKTSAGSDEASKYLGSPKNTTANGTPIPIGYGLYKVYGHFISFNISSSSLVIGGSDEK